MLVALRALLVSVLLGYLYWLLFGPHLLLVDLYRFFGLYLHICGTIATSSSAATVLISLKVNIIAMHFSVFLQRNFYVGLLVLVCSGVIQHPFDVRVPCKHAIMCQNRVVISPMLIEFDQWRPCSGTLWYIWNTYVNDDKYHDLRFICIGGYIDLIVDFSFVLIWSTVH